MRLKLVTTHLVACGILVSLTVCVFPVRAQNKSSTYHGPVFEDVEPDKRPDRAASILARQTLCDRIHERWSRPV